jgi:hypothetical protein
MSNKINPKSSAPPLIYQIRIRGHLAPPWAEWFEDATITLEDDGRTLLTCAIIDQAALHGLLKKVRDLGLPLLSVNRMDAGPKDSPDT